MIQEEQEQYNTYQKNFPSIPTLIDPKFNAPIFLVSEDLNDIMNSRLLCSKSLCDQIDEIKTTKKEKLVCIEEFLSEVLQPVPIVSESNTKSQEILTQQFQRMENIKNEEIEEQMRIEQLTNQIQEEVLLRCQQLKQSLIKSSQIVKQEQILSDNYRTLHKVVESNPFQLAHLPTREESIKKITQLKASEELSQFLFDLCKKKRFWNNNSTQQLRQLKQIQEEFYTQNLQASTNQQSPLHKTALNYFIKQIDEITDQVKSILESEDDVKEKKYIDLEFNHPESLELLTNEMLTPETRVIYKIENREVSANEGVTLKNCLSKLKHLENLKVELFLDKKVNVGLEEFANGIKKLHHLKSLTFSASKLNQEQSKVFFGDLCKGYHSFKQLEQLIFDFEDTPIQKEAFHYIVKTIQHLGHDQVKVLDINFKGCELGAESGQAIGEALKPYKSLKQLSIDLSGYSLSKNTLKDQGFASLLQHIPQTLTSLRINVGENSLTNQSLVDLRKIFKNGNWSKLKKISFAFNRNSITDLGLNELKFLKKIPILLDLNLNLSQNLFTLDPIKHLIQKLPQYLQNVSINLRSCGLPEEQTQDYLRSVQLENSIMT